jgi:HD-GYP domain-containing protein (c-di-GMP phosphodiesterase class II)
MIDSFENLTNNEKAHRKKKAPFGAMKIIQDEILKTGKFDKDIFTDLCLSLLGKRKYS